MKQENGSSNYQRTQWDRFLHAGWHFDLRENNESNQKLTVALPLGSQPICDMFTPRLWRPPCLCLAFCLLSGSVTIFTTAEPINRVWKVMLAVTHHVSVVSAVNSGKLYLNSGSKQVKAHLINPQPVINLESVIIPLWLFYERFIIDFEYLMYSKYLSYFESIFLFRSLRIGQL